MLGKWPRIFLIAGLTGLLIFIGMELRERFGFASVGLERYLFIGSLGGLASFIAQLTVRRLCRPSS